jgi:ligand-binding SRPBCC domain-containing protein
MTFERKTFIPVPPPELFRFFADPANLGRITPPSMHFRTVEGPDRPLRAGDRIRYRLRVAMVPIGWTSVIASWNENESFSDLQERGPYRYWLHTHRFRAVEGGTEMLDHVEYQLPLGWLGGLVAGWFVTIQLRAIFDFRGHTIRTLFG